MKKLKPAEIAHIRHQLGATQSVMAALLGVHAVTICKWEKGRNRPTPWQEMMLRAFWDAAKADPDLKYEVCDALAKQGVVRTLTQVLAAAFEK